MKTQEYEYEALIFCDDDFVASASSADYGAALHQGMVYMQQYAEEGEVEMQIYKKELVHTETIR